MHDIIIIGRGKSEGSALSSKAWRADVVGCAWRERVFKPFLLLRKWGS